MLLIAVILRSGGLRFHMGAYIGAGELEAWSKHRFALFDRAQCRAIVAFLRYLSRDDYLGKDAERALPYWQERVASSS